MRLSRRTGGTAYWRMMGGVFLRHLSQGGMEWNGGGHALELNLVDGGGRNQTYTSDPEARLWLQAEHHVTFIVDGFARTITSVADGVFVRRPHPPLSPL